MTEGPRVGGSAPQEPAPLLYDFEVQVVDIPWDGSPVVQWGRAVPVTTRARDRNAAREQALVAMGDPPRGRKWASRVKSAVQVTS